jgi:elongator complex protein 1
MEASLAVVIFQTHLTRADNIKLTSLKYSNVPPPMAAHDVSLGSNIIDCAMKSLDPRRIRIAALANQFIYVLDWVADDISKYPIIHAEIPYEEQLRSQVEDEANISAMQVAFSGTESLILLCSQGSKSLLCNLSLSDSKLRIGKSGEFSDIQEISQHGESDDGRFLLGQANGDIHIHPEIASKGYEFNHFPLREFLLQWDSFDILRTHRLHSDESNGLGREESTCVSLARSGSLKTGQRVLANNCTSFLITYDHIIFTTSKHLLKFIHVGAVEQLEVPPDTPEADERCRSIERGAKLVTVIPSRSALVLQMPRGNLETIYPRALVLADIRRAINRKHYKKAFLACRSHRVDMNILHDHNPSAFLKDVSIFIAQVEKVEYIDLFLSQLREEDVSLTMYKETSKDNASRILPNGVAVAEIQPALKPGDSKVNLICGEFVESLRSLGMPHLQNLITAYVCKNPPDLSSGLKEVAKLQAEGSEAMGSAVEHICFLVDLNRLYDAALGLYDLKLALLVAQQSQKDPREYLPFLNKLHAQSSLRMKFDIDNHLGRKRLCLEHLRELDAFEELKSYTVKHEMYGEALELYKYQEGRLSELMQLYAEHLTSKSRHKEAGCAFEYLRDYESACESYRLANLWRESLTSAYAASFSTDRIQDLARSISDGLIELKDFTSAAIVAYEHLNDVEAAARLFCKAYLFANAARILSLNNRRDLLESVLDVGLTDGMSSMTELLADCKSQLNAQIPRIRELRVKKEQEPLSFYDAGANEGADIPDNVSLAPTDASTTGGTLFTRYTNRTGTVGTNATRKTAKNRRKEERKKAMGKKGSVYEEEYLVNSVERLIERVDSVHEDVGRLVMALMQRRMRERAKAVQEAMATVVQLCQECIPEVFQVEEHKETETDQERPMGADGLRWESMEALRQKRPPPVVKSFARLSLAGGDS